MHCDKTQGDERETLLHIVGHEFPARPDAAAGRARSIALLWHTLHFRSVWLLVIESYGMRLLVAEGVIHQLRNAKIAIWRNALEMI